MCHNKSQYRGTRKLVRCTALFAPMIPQVTFEIGFISDHHRVASSVALGGPARD